MFFRKADDPVSELNAILQAYQTVAGSNPQKLRGKISPTEVWRFFIDGFRQRNVRDLKSAAVFKKPLFYIHNPLDITVSHYITTVEKIDIKKAETSHVVNMIKQYFGWSLSDEQIEQLTLQNLLDLDRGWFPYELNEQGYLKAMHHGFSVIFDFSHDLNLDFIKLLHVMVTNGVSGTLFDSAEQKTGEFRQESDTGPRITYHSKAGVKSFVSQMRDNNEAYKDMSIIFNFYNKFIFDINNTVLRLVLSKEFQDSDNETKRIKLLSFYKNAEIPDQIEGLIAELMLIKNVDDFSEFLSTYIKEQDKTFHIHLLNNQSNKDTKKLELLITFLLNRYKKSIAESKSPLDKLVAIIDFIQDCERTHPFIDANTRTFSMLLLNRLLMNNGFPLAMLDNPNLFGSLLSREELGGEIITGMQNTFDLIKNGYLQGVNTDELFELIHSKSSLAKNADYFLTVCELERRERNHVPRQYGA